MTDPELSLKQRSIWQDCLIPIAVGLVGISGSLGGVYLAGELNIRQAESQKLLDYENQILNQRIAVLERASKIFGKAPGIQDVWSKYSKSFRNSKGELNNPPLDIVEKLTDYQGEYQSVVSLAGIYFGPKTRTAIADMSSEKKPWWNKSKKNQDAFFAAMSTELTLDLKRLTTLNQRVSP